MWVIRAISLGITSMAPRILQRDRVISNRTVFLERVNIRSRYFYLEISSFFLFGRFSRHNFRTLGYEMRNFTIISDFMTDRPEIE